MGPLNVCIKELLNIQETHKIETDLKSRLLIRTREEDEISEYASRAAPVTPWRSPWTVHDTIKKKDISLLFVYLLLFNHLYASTNK